MSDKLSETQYLKLALYFFVLATIVALIWYDWDDVFWPVIGDLIVGGVLVWKWYRRRKVKLGLTVHSGRSRILGR